MTVLPTRLPRATFTKKLVQICKALDSADVRAVHFKDILGRPASCKMRIVRMWVAGSYARGATTCGDLDLVCETELLEGYRPRFRKVARAFFGLTREVSYFEGTPEKNSSNVSFSDAVCVWSGKGCDWSAAIEGIRADATAGRASRKTDCIPLAPEQLAADMEELENLISEKESGRLEWNFAPFDYVSAAKMPALPTTTEELERDSIWWHARNLGQKTRLLLPQVERLLQDIEPYGVWSRWDFTNPTLFKCGGSLVILGRPWIAANFLNGRLDVRQLVLVPHFTAKGPNGAWIIRKGQHHTDVEALDGLKAWYHTYRGRPSVIHEYQEGDPPHAEPIPVIEFFCSEDAAVESAKAISEDDYQLHVEVAVGRELLDLCGLAAAVYVDGQGVLGCCHAGWQVAEVTHDATVKNLVSLLASMARNR